MKCLAGYKCTEVKDISRAICLLNPSQRTLFVDIGSGEGHVICAIAQQVGCNCVGIENDAELVSISSQTVASSRSLSSLITIVEADALSFNFHNIFSNHQGDFVIYLFLSHFGYEMMGDVLLAQCPVGTRVLTVSNPIDHGLWTPKCVWLGDNIPAGSMRLFLYVIDENMKRELARDMNGAKSFAKTPVKQLVHWIHPPPGSYLPRSIPATTKCFPACSTPAEIHAFLCKTDVYKHHKISGCHQLSNENETNYNNLSVNGKVDKKAVNNTSTNEAVCPKPPPLPTTLHFK